MSEQSLLIQISKDLATNTEATKNIEKHLVTLNGKVATQEALASTLKTAVDMQATALQGLITKDEKRADNKSRIAWLTIENIFKFVFGVAITYLLFRAGIH